MRNSRLHEDSSAVRASPDQRAMPAVGEGIRTRQRADVLGDAMKALEMAEAGRKAMPRLPVVARLDGRAFHTLTRGMERPFDPWLSRAMVETTKALVEEFHAAIGYTQSDEITLAWREPRIFDGRWQKLTSVLAGYASATFVRHLDAFFPTKRNATPCFDCRAWQVPSLADVIDVFAWREWDAVKNSVAMAAQSVYSHRELHGQGRADMMDMLHAKGINWNDYPAHFKRGVYMKRRVVERTLTAEERERIPEKHRPAQDATFERGEVYVVDLPPIRQVADPVSVFFPADRARLPSQPASEPSSATGTHGDEASEASSSVGRSTGSGR